MKKVIQVLPEMGDHKSKKGNIFEGIIKLLLESQQYTVTQNVHITGLEIDLLAQHQIKNEILYAECKAKQKPKSEEIKKFVFAMDYGVEEKMPDYGYFIYTEELDKQAAGLKIKMEAQKKNISFLGPNRIIKILEDSKHITPFLEEKLFNKNISKISLVFCPYGTYYVPLLQDGSIPKFFTIIDKRLKAINDKEIIEYLVKELKELTNLKFIPYNSKKINIATSIDENNRDTITEIKQSENWYDYTPASIDHFIGRLHLKRDLRVFLDNVRKRKTKNRIFFLDGKSGWGKSSLLAELHGYTKKSKYWKSRVYTLVVDTRSANTGNFIGLAFKKLIEKAINDKFIQKNMFTPELEFISPYDVLSHDSAKQILSQLKLEKKVLVLIFDQFEDQFRNEFLFEAFYQFCKDVDALKENLIVGFSWKTEINIPLGNPAYHNFNQLKEYSYCITIPEFSQNDARQVVKQLEATIETPVGLELERKLIESSQGFPWLIKKLCIHTLHQFQAGKTIDELLEQELNYKELFENDLLSLSGPEQKALNYIAQRAYDGNPFEISELDKISQDILDSLINQRLIIRTGSSYNIYWDIFRDYIVTKEIPVIGESYLLRQSGNTCLETFLLFEKNSVITIHELLEKTANRISEKSMLNVLLELRSLGLIKKHKGQDIFELTDRVSVVSEHFFSQYIASKFESYTLIIELNKLTKSEITFEDIVDVQKTIFKTEVFQEKTWLTYARNLALWIKIGDPNLYSRIVKSRRGPRGISIKDKANQRPYYSPSVLIKSYRKYLSGETIKGQKYRDLILFDLVDDDDFPIDLMGQSIAEYLAKKAYSFNRLKEVYEFYENNPSSKTKDIINNLPHLVKGNKSEVSKLQTGSVILSWGVFMYQMKHTGEFKVSQSRKSKSNNYYLAFGPNHAIDTIIALDRNTLAPTPNNNRKVRDLEVLEIIDENSWSLTENGLNILNATEPEIALAMVAEKDAKIKEFLNLIVNKNEIPSKKQIKLKEPNSFFNNMSPSTKKTRAYIYKSWAEIILKKSSS